MRRFTTTILAVLALTVSACGDDGGSSSDADGTTSAPAADATTAPESSTTVPTTTGSTTTTPTTEPTTEPTTTTTTTTSTTTGPPVEDGPLIANPDRPWVRPLRDELLERSGMNIEAANCVFETTEREGFDMRLLVWSDTSTPAEFTSLIGLCGTELSGGYDLPPVTRIDAAAYGDDATLDTWWDWCAAGDGGACDQLWWGSNSDSEYEAFGASCGAGVDGGTDFGDCAVRAGQSAYGDSLLYDAWHDSCADGYGFSCDSLESEAPAGSAYWTFGASCGEQVPASEDNECTGLLPAPA